MALLSGLAAESYDRSYSDRELVRRVAGYFRDERRRMLLVAALILLQSLLGTASPLLITHSIDVALANPTPQAILASSLGILAAGILAWTVGYVRERVAVRATANAVLRLRLDLFNTVLRHDLAFYDDRTTGVMVSRVTWDTQDFAQVVSLVTNLISQLSLILIFMAVLLYIRWQLALLVLLLLPLVILVARGLRHVSRPVAVQEKRMRAIVKTSVGDSISGIAVAKSFRHEETLYREFERINRQAYRINLRRGLVLESMFPVLFALRALVTTVILFAGGFSAVHDQISPGTWYLFVQALELFMEPLLGIASFWGRFQDGLSASERVFALLDAEPRVIQNGKRSIDRLQGAIEFRNVRFAYKAGEDVLRGFSLSIPPGQTLAFVGHTGAGKSSLTRLIARFYEFQDGQILVDGQDIRSCDLSQYRRQIGLVPQSPFLFSGSLLDNVRYAVPDATDAQVLRAVQRIGNGDWLDDLPHGLQTDVGERGANLSMGQRQLVALARVLIQDPAVLVLDEATASVDPFTEAQIQEGLEEVFRDRTAIIIAHRLSTVKKADRIIVLGQGQIIEQGTHDALLAQGGHYAMLYNTYFRHQSREYIEQSA